MKVKYAVQSEFECVYLVNGSFRDTLNVVEYASDSPLYITVFPLKAMLLPYTVKLLAGRIMNNHDLADSFEVSESCFTVRLKERHNYVYSPVSPHAAQVPSGVVPAFWKAVKSGELTDARRLLTKELSDSVDDDSLTAFFAPYSDIVPNTFPDIDCSYFLINTETGKSEPYSFQIVNGHIADIDSK